MSKIFDPNQFGPGVKKADLKPCCLCNKGVLHDNLMACTRVRVTRMFANVVAIQRQHGLELMLGGRAAIADAMGPNEDLLVPVHTEVTLLICDECAIRRHIAAVWEIDQPTEPTAGAPALGAELGDAT